jgi:hypothetical protein
LPHRSARDLVATPPASSRCPFGERITQPITRPATETSIKKAGRPVTSGQIKRKVTFCLLRCCVQARLRSSEILVQQGSDRTVSADGRR